MTYGRFRHTRETSINSERRIGTISPSEMKSLVMGEIRKSDKDEGPLRKYSKMFTIAFKIQLSIKYLHKTTIHTSILCHPLF